MVPESPNFKPSNGRVEAEVTRYGERTINPEVTNGRRPNKLAVYPLHHIKSDDSKVYRSDTAHFPTPLIICTAH